MAETARTSVIAELRHTQCRWCASGTLLEARFKGNAALVCDECGTPGVQFW